MSELASNLEKKTLNGWFVEKKLFTTGGFSSGYAVRHDDGTKAFMKAINLGYAADSTQFKGRRVDLMNFLTEGFKYERDLLKLCRDENLDRIVVALDSGEYDEPGAPYFVPYLIFEFCKEGDVRHHPKLKEPGLAWRLKVFHGVCLGIRQLHSRRIAHEDLKPENVLVFANDMAKLADLGNSLRDDHIPRNQEFGHRGDLSFAPVELLYRHYETDWDSRHKGADFYMLGGLFAFLTANVHVFSLVLTKLPPAFNPKRWQGTYKDALPAVQKATNEAIEEISTAMPQEIRADSKAMLTWLLHPEPTKRGHPETIASPGSARYSLERIISVADKISSQARRIK